MRLRELMETSSAGSSSAGSVASVMPSAYAKPKSKKNRYGAPKANQLYSPNGTAKNALDVKGNIFGTLKISENQGFYSDIITEEMIFEGFLDSAKLFLGNKINQTVSDIKGAVTDMQSAGVLIKDIITNPDYLEKVNDQLKKQNNNYIKQINNLASTNQLVLNLWNRIKPIILNFLNATSWKGFLSRLGMVGFLKFIIINVNELKDTVVDSILSKFTELENIIPSVTLGGFLQVFEGLQLVKKYFLDTLTSIKQKLDFGKNIGQTESPNIFNSPIKR